MIIMYQSFLLMLVVIGRGADAFTTIRYRLKTPVIQSIRSSSNSLLSPASASSVPTSLGTAKQPSERVAVGEARLFALSPIDPSSSSNHSSPRREFEKRLSTFTLLTPLWTIFTALVATWKAPICSNIFGSLPVMQNAYASLMFFMGLTISPKDFKRAVSNPFILSVNALLCFGLMPLLACVIAKALSYSSSQTIGLILLGSVGGGQASNLFTLIARGDVALSVICTTSTTLLGVFSTPLLVKYLLSCSIDVDGRGILESITTLVLIPVFTGSSLAKIFPNVIKKVSPFLPTLGVLSTLVLVAGGSSNSVVTTSTLAAAAGNNYSHWLSLLVPSILLSCLGGAIALCVTKRLGLNEQTKRTLVIETLSKSPTLAYVLALKHFPLSVSPIPSGAMVSLAVVGALIASLWSTIGNNSPEIRNSQQ
uniref:Uncharacterized protein n=1 Tax=Pseudo-nitzschia australis TaxID=44445 RepID=A0A7S4AWR1_9STRA